MVLRKGSAVHRVECGREGHLDGSYWVATASQGHRAGYQVCIAGREASGHDSKSRKGLETVNRPRTRRSPGGQHDPTATAVLPAGRAVLAVRQAPPVCPLCPSPWFLQACIHCCVSFFTFFKSTQWLTYIYFS